MGRISNYVLANLELVQSEVVTTPCVRRMYTEAFFKFISVNVNKVYIICIINYFPDQVDSLIKNGFVSMCRLVLPGPDMR